MVVSGLSVFPQGLAIVLIDFSVPKASRCAVLWETNYVFGEIGFEVAF